ncbi:MAG TPA: hypothetical protein VG323_07760 [Thermoanaerobaculia bacterium]|nr:hypothetical protein [Thermoanaerobaculia bacterium]
MTVAKMRGVTEAGADLTMLAGVWANTNEWTPGIARIVMRDDAGVLQVRITGGDGRDWGSVPADVYFQRNDEGLEQPFTTSFDFGSSEITLQGFLRQGVLVVLSFTRFRDGRTNHFSKEFFYRVG